MLDEHRIAALNMGLLLGVARGSQEPPRLVVLSARSDQAPLGTSMLGLVGKGITFDTGGISIKPAENMDKMKDDMSGGAAVIAAMAAIARLRVAGPVCRHRADDREHAGRQGSQARGRAHQRDRQDGRNPEHGCRRTTGPRRRRLVRAAAGRHPSRRRRHAHRRLRRGARQDDERGCSARRPAWVAAVQEASERAGDRSWPMPVFDDYKEQLKSEIADFTNTGGRAGGAITGALFIHEFTGDLPWVHIDIAGTAWAEESKPYQPKGATGVGVRTLVELALAADAWSKLKVNA